MIGNLQRGPVLRRLHLVLAFALAAALGAGPPRTYRIATTTWMGWAFLDVADAKGFWKAQGLAVELQHYPDGGAYLDAQLSRKADFACAMVGDMAWIHARVAPVQILLETDWSLGGDKFLVRKGRALKDLAGQPIGVYQGTYALPFFLRQTLGADFRHVRASSFVHLNPTDMAAQIRAGRLHMAVLFDPFAAALQDVVTVRARSSDRPGCIPEGVFGFRSTIETMPPGDLDALLKGIIRALAWMEDPANDAELLEIVRARSFHDQPPAHLRELRQARAEAPTHRRDRLKARNAPQGGLTAFLADLSAFVRETDPQAKPFKPGDLFDPRPASRALAGPP